MPNSRLPTRLNGRYARLSGCAAVNWICGLAQQISGVDLIDLLIEYIYAVFVHISSLFANGPKHTHAHIIYSMICMYR